MTPQKRFKDIDFSMRLPPVLFVLQDLYGYTSAEIGRIVKRSPNQIAYYRTRRTKIPTLIHRRLKSHLRKCAFTRYPVHSPSADKLSRAIHTYALHIIKQYEELHRDKKA